MMVPICSWKEGEVAFLTFLLIETQVVVWSPVNFLLLGLFAACAAYVLLHVAHSALSQPRAALLSHRRAVPRCVSQVEHPSAGKKKYEI